MGEKNIFDALENLVDSLKISDETIKLKQLLNRVKESKDINCQNENGENLFHIVCLSGNVDLVKFFIRNGANFWTTTKHKETALHYAVKSNNKKIVELLLQTNRGNIHQENNYRVTALDLAVAIGNRAIVKILQSEFPYYWAAKLYLPKKKHLIEDSNNGEKKIFDALENLVDSLKISDEKIDLKQLLNRVKESKDINCPNDNGDTLSHIVCLSGNVDLVKFFIRNGASFLYTTKNNDTTLHYAVKSNNEEIVELLLEKNAGDIDKSNNYGRIPLDLAMEIGNIAIVKLLLRKSRFSAKTYDGYTALQLAAKLGFIDIASELASQIIYTWPSVNEKNKDGYTALHYASQSSDIKLVNILINKKANVKYVTNDGLSALHFASMKSIDAKDDQANVEIINFLIKNGANLYQKSHDGFTCLHYAAKFNNFYVIETILAYIERNFVMRYLVNVQIPSNGYTALHMAAENGNLEIVQSLLKSGAIYNLKDNSGKTPLEVSKNDGVSKYLQFVKDAFLDLQDGKVDACRRLRSLPRGDFWTIVNAYNDQGKTLHSILISVEADALPNPPSGASVKTYVISERSAYLKMLFLNSKLN